MEINYFVLVGALKSKDDVESEGIISTVQSTTSPTVYGVLPGETGKSIVVVLRYMYVLFYY